jgi:hypothetical protein
MNGPNCGNLAVFKANNTEPNKMAGIFAEIGKYAGLE